MAVSQSRASIMTLMAVVIVTLFSLIGASLAADAPAPSPTSSAGVISPSFAVGGLVVTFVAFLFGSAFKLE